MVNNELTVFEDIQKMIFTVRGVQVMMDTDLALCYGVEVRRLNEQVKRNKDRFPDSFCFQLNEKDLENLKSQFATSSWGGRRTRPYVFTEQGVAMLSAVLKTKVAVEMSVRIMNAFVAMRRFLISNALIFQRLDSIEIRLLDSEKKMEKVLEAIESKDIHPKQGIFYDGQIFDAYDFVSSLIKSAKRSIIIVDNYLDDSIFTLLTKRNDNVRVLLFTKNLSKSMIQDLKKMNEQYPLVEMKFFGDSHDRFIIIDDTDLYHFGASLKDLGKKWFAFSKMDIEVVEVISKLKRYYR